MNTKKLIEYCTITNYYFYLKLFKQYILASIMTTYWQAILVSIKLKGLLTRNIISQALKKMLRSLSRVETFV